MPTTPSRIPATAPVASTRGLPRSPAVRGASTPVAQNSVPCQVPWPPRRTARCRRRGGGRRGPWCRSGTPRPWPRPPSRWPGSSSVKSAAGRSSSMRRTVIPVVGSVPTGHGRLAGAVRLDHGDRCGRPASTGSSATTMPPASATMPVADDGRRGPVDEEGHRRVVGRVGHGRQLAGRRSAAQVDLGGGYPGHPGAGRCATRRGVVGGQASTTPTTTTVTTTQAAMPTDHPTSDRGRVAAAATGCRPAPGARPARRDGATGGRRAGPSRAAGRRRRPSSSGQRRGRLVDPRARSEGYRPPAPKGRRGTGDRRHVPRRGRPGGPPDRPTMTGWPGTSRSTSGPPTPRCSPGAGGSSSRSRRSSPSTPAATRCSPWGTSACS